MPLLIRKVPKSWADIIDLASWSADDIPAGVIDTLYSSEGLSVWLTSSDDERLAVAAAMTMGFSKIGDFTWIGIEQKDIEKIGIRIERKDADTPLDMANKLHRNLYFNSAKQIIEFAYICRAADMETITEDDILTRMSSLIRNDPDIRQKLVRVDVYKKEFSKLLEKHHSLVRDLFKSGAINFRS